MSPWERDCCGVFTEHHDSLCHDVKEWISLGCWSSEKKQMLAPKLGFEQSALCPCPDFKVKNISFFLRLSPRDR